MHLPYRKCICKTCPTSFCLCVYLHLCLLHLFIQLCLHLVFVSIPSLFLCLWPLLSVCLAFCLCLCLCLVLEFVLIFVLSPFCFCLCPPCPSLVPHLSSPSTSLFSCPSSLHLQLFLCLHGSVNLPLHLSLSSLILFVTPSQSLSHLSSCLSLHL